MLSTRPLSLLLLLLLSAGSYAETDEHEIARIAFSADSGVVDEITAHQERGFSRTDYATPTLLSGQCGFVGCSKNFLVAQEMRNDGINTSNVSVIRLVTLPASGGEDNIQIKRVDCGALGAPAHAGE